MSELTFWLPRGIFNSYNTALEHEMISYINFQMKKNEKNTNIIININK